MSSCFLRTIWAKMIIPSNNTFWQQQGAGDSLLEFSRGYKLVQSLCKTICHYLVTLRAHLLGGASRVSLRCPPWRICFIWRHEGRVISPGELVTAKTLEMCTRTRICKHSVAESHSPTVSRFENKPSAGTCNNKAESQQSSGEPRSPNKRA